MPKIYCFCVYDCAGMDIAKKDKNQAKKTKTSTRFGKVSKAEVEEANYNFGSKICLNQP